MDDAERAESNEARAELLMTVQVLRARVASLQASVHRLTLERHEALSRYRGCLRERRQFEARVKELEAR